MDSAYNYCLIGGFSDVGRVRKANEDRGGWFDTPNGRVGVVCDGMGGHVGGQIASQTAIEAIHEFLCNNQFDNVNEAITKAIFYANQAILNKAQIQPELTGMGSTCVMIIIRQGIVYYGHVGDSRIYIVSNRIIKQLTSDHSFVQMLVDTGQITEEEAERHPRKNEITNALGIPNMQAPTVAKNPISPIAGTCFVLCSDGLTGMVDNKKIEKVVCNRNLSLDNRAKELVKLANEAGGVDNITVQLVEFALGTSDIEFNKAIPESGSRKRNKRIAVSLVGFILILLAIFFVHRILTEKLPLQRTEKQIKGDSILFEKGKRIKPLKPFKDKTIFKKDSCTLIDVYKNYISINDVNSRGDEILLEWTKKDFTGDKIEIRIATDSIIYLITIPVEKVKQPTAPMVINSDLLTGPAQNQNKDIKKKGIGAGNPGLNNKNAEKGNKMGDNQPKNDTSIKEGNGTNKSLPPDSVGNKQRSDTTKYKPV